MKTIILFVGAIGANLFGHATWILALANFVWLLFKDVALFSWWWVGFTATGFIISLITIFVSYFSHLND